MRSCVSHSSQAVQNEDANFLFHARNCQNLQPPIRLHPARRQSRKAQGRSGRTSYCRDQGARRIGSRCAALTCQAACYSFRVHSRIRINVKTASRQSPRIARSIVMVRTLSSPSGSHILILPSLGCAYKRGVCAICGKAVLDTTGYVMSAK